MVYCGCLENSWVNILRGSNPFPSANEAMVPYYLMMSIHCISSENTDRRYPRINSNVDGVRQLRKASSRSVIN